MQIQNLQSQMQAIIDANPRPRDGYEDIVLLFEMERFNSACLDYMATYDIPRIKGHVVVYSKYECPKCDQLKQWLADHSVPYTLRTLNVEFTRDWLLETFTGVQSYPVVTICGVWYTDIDKAKSCMLEGI